MKEPDDSTPIHNPKLHFTFTTRHLSTQRTDHLYYLHDLYHLYGMYDMYDLYNLCGMYDLNDFV